MTTTKHPTVLAAEQLIEHAAVLLREKWHRRGDGTKAYGVPEALLEAAADARVERVLAERQLVNGGVDIWWNDLLCIDAEDAATSVEALAVIDPVALYGDRWEANLGLLTLASTMSAAHLNGLSNVIRGEQWQAFELSIEYARAHGRERMLQQLCEDIHYATAAHASTPAGVARRLKGIRALECVAAHHVLMDVLPVEVASSLVEPVATMLLPFHRSV